MDKDNLKRIVEIVQEDPSQFELLYKEMVNRVYYWCYSVVGNEDDAKDAAQEAMIRIYNKLYTLKTAETFSSWAFILVRNVCYAYLRKSKNNDRIFMDSDEFNDDFENTIKEERVEVLPKEAYELKSKKELIVFLIQQLPLKQREVIILFYLEEYKISEIAKLCDCNIGTIKSRLHDGRKNLEKTINEYQEKNDVKLYGVAILPLLGLLLNDYCDSLKQYEMLKYDDVIVKATNVLQTTRFSHLVSFLTYISDNLLVFANVIVALSVATNVNAMSSPQSENYNIASSNINESEDNFNDEIPTIFEEIKENSNFKNHAFIKDIMVQTYPTREALPIEVLLKEGVSGVSVTFENEIIESVQDVNTLTFLAKENGVYTLKYQTKEKQIVIDSIAKDAPQLKEVRQIDGITYLIIDGDTSNIDYTKSYIKYNGKDYMLDKAQIEAVFDGDIIVVLYDKNDAYIQYRLTF